MRRDLPGLLRFLASLTAAYELAWAGYNAAHPGRVDEAHIAKELAVGSLALATIAVIDAEG